MPLRAELHGGESLKRKFNALSGAVRGRLLERAVIAGALLIQNDAKRRVHRLTGNLARSIHIGGHTELNSEGGSVIQRTGDPVPSPEIADTQVAVYVGTDVDYAAAEEFGLGTRPARPYLRPAADENHLAVQREIGEAMRDLIRAAAL